MSHSTIPFDDLDCLRSEDRLEDFGIKPLLDEQSQVLDLIALMDQLTQKLKAHDY